MWRTFKKEYKNGLLQRPRDINDDVVEYNYNKDDGEEDNENKDSAAEQVLGGAQEVKVPVAHGHRNGVVNQRSHALSRSTG